MSPNNRASDPEFCVRCNPGAGYVCPDHGPSSSVAIPAAAQDLVPNDPIPERYRAPYAAFLAGLPVGHEDNTYWPVFADAIDAARRAESGRIVAVLRARVEVGKTNFESFAWLRGIEAAADLIERGDL